MTRRPPLAPLHRPIGVLPSRDLLQGDHVCYPVTPGEDSTWATGVVTRVVPGLNGDDRWLWIQPDEPDLPPLDTVLRLQYRDRLLYLTPKEAKARRGPLIYLDALFRHPKPTPATTDRNAS